MMVVLSALCVQGAMGCPVGQAWPPPPLSRGFVAAATMSAAEITRVKIRGVPPGHAYYNKSLLFLVHVAGGVVRHSDPAAHRRRWGTHNLPYKQRCIHCRT